MRTLGLLLCTVISANHLSMYGAAADLWKQLSKDSEVAGKFGAPDHLETMEIPTDLFIAETQKLLPMHSNGET